jgi:hypothetical protein
VTRRRWYVVGAAIFAGLLVYGLITGSMPMKIYDVSRALDPRGFAFMAALYGAMSLGCIYAAFKWR